MNQAAEIFPGRERLSATELLPNSSSFPEKLFVESTKEGRFWASMAPKGPPSPKWQVTPNGKILPDLLQLFKLLGGAAD
jgi:hypothetical protein